MNQLSTNKYKELLGILIDHKLTIENHLLNIVLETDLSQFIRNLQILTTEMYKILNRLSPDIMQDIFETTSNYIILVMHQHFPQEILKQLDMDSRPPLTWLQKFGTLYLKRWNKLLLWINPRPKSKSGS